MTAECVCIGETSDDREYFDLLLRAYDTLSPSKPHFSALQSGCFLEGMEPVFLGFEEVGRCVGSRPSSVGEEKSPDSASILSLQCIASCNLHLHQGKFKQICLFFLRDMQVCFYPINYFSGSIKAFWEIEIVAKSNK